MRRPRHLWFAAMVAGVLAGCSLLTDLDGYTGGHTAAAVDGSTDASSDAASDAATCDAATDPGFLGDAVDVAVGYNFACAVRAGGTVVCWGNNDNGQLGSTGPARTTPIAVPDLGRVKAITAGTGFACALDADANVWCWGTNAEGEMGSGSTDTVAHVPTRVGGLTGVTAVHAGYHHACAVTGGGVTCWGANTKGQLGRTTAGAAPAAVAGIANVTELATGGDYTCALGDTASARTLSCWGTNGDGQLQRSGGDSPTPVTIALTIAAPDGLRRIAGGNGHICARDTTGALACWGENDFGQLGANLQYGPPSTVIQVLSTLGKPVDFAIGDDFTCAAQGDGTVSCLGANFFAQLGNGTIDPPLDGSPSVVVPHTTATKVKGLTGVTRLASLAGTICGIVAACPAAGGSVYCWGANDSGQLGGGDRSVQLAPVRVLAP